MIAAAAFSIRSEGLLRRIAAWAPRLSPNSNSNSPYQTNLNSVSKMASENGGPNDMGCHKKHKAVLQVWRPMSTHPVSSGDRSEAGPEPLEMQTISCLSTRAQLEQDSILVDSSVSGSSANTFSYEDQAATEGSQSVGNEIKDSLMQETDIMKDAELASGHKKHSVSVEVDASLMRFVKGKGDSVQKQIEENIGVKLIFPSAKQDTKIVIEGNTDAAVTVALERINTLLEEAVQSPRLDYSHFISLPLAVHPELVEKLNRFQKSIFGEAASSQDNNTDNELDEEAAPGDEKSHNVACKLAVEDKKEHVRARMDATGSKTATKESILSDMGIDRSIFIKPKTFHLTVLMLKLWNKERVAAAAEVLQRISSKVLDALDNRSISLRLRGLMCMKGSPAKARVVYIPVKESGDEGRLLRACQVIIDAFVEAGLVLEKDAHQSLKLHATLINVRHRKRHNKVKQFDTFDARHIFRVHGSEDWGEYPIKDIHLSQRFKFDDKGYYHCCASIPLPENI